MKVKPEDLANSLITEAHASVVSQFFIEDGKTRHVIYIHDIIVKPTGELDIKYSTPSEHVDKQWLSEEVHNAIKLIYCEVKEKEKSLFSKFVNYFRR